MAEPDSDGDASQEAVPDPFDAPDWSGSDRCGQVRADRKRSWWRRHLRALICVGAFAVLVAGAVAWLFYTGLKARHELRAVRDGVNTLRSEIYAGDLVAARATAAYVRAEADAAQQHTSGPVWSLAAAIPGLGDPFDTVRSLTDSVRVVAESAMTPLIAASDQLQPGELRLADGGFDLPALEHLGPTLRGVSAAIAQAITMTRHSAGHTWLGTVNAARNELLDQLAGLRTTITGVEQAVQLLPPLLGADGPRTYLISFENEAELRATGGIPGAFAILRADAGELSFTTFESDAYFSGVRTRLNFGADFAQLYQPAQQDYADTTYSPHFPYAAQIWSSMWQQKTGERLDGAMAMDPTALGYLLAVTGPVTLADGTELSSANVVSLSEQTLYDRFPAPAQTDQRKQYLLELAKAVSAKLLAPHVDVTGLVHAAGQAAEEHRILFWVRDPALERGIAAHPVGGTLPQTQRPYLAVALNNDSQSKLDYYLHAGVQWHRTGCGPMRDVTVTVTLTNDAPVTLPAYVEGNSWPIGANRFDLAVYGTIGGRFTRVTVNGKPPFYVSGLDQQHPAFVVTVDVPRGNISTAVFHLKEPAGRGPLLVRDQPMVNPMTVTVDDARC